jgi:hypothetical protein
MAWNDNIIPSLVNNYARTASANARPYSGIVVHVTGKQTLGDELNWMKTNGQGLGYHYVIDRDGKVYQTAPLDKRMNQVLPDLNKSYNNNNAIGVAMVAGGTPGEEPPPFSPAQLASGRTLVDGLRGQYNIPTNRIAGHGQIQTDREAGNKLNAAGGFEGQDFINFYNKSANAPSSDGTATTAASTAAAPSRPGSYGQTGITLLNAELAKRGINPAAASGAIAGIMGESGANLDPTSFNSKDPGGGSGGIAQWNRTRLVGNTGMLAFAKNAGIDVDVNNPLDAKKVPLAVQAQYLGHELDTTYAGVRDQLKTVQNPQDALKIWVNSYENPADKAGAIAQRSQYLAPVATALGTTLNSTPSGAPTTPAGGPAATPAAGTTLPGFQPGSPANKMAQDALKKLGGGDAGGEQPQAPPLQMAQSQAMGGPMMMQPGGQNFQGRALAAQDLAQQGYMMQPTLQAFTPGGGQPPVPSAGIASSMPGGATGMPALPGTTLNSPSQLQMALMSGALSPYDMYARQQGSM